MAQRATVQEAVELLKIYQLRRENAALSQQIQHLHNAVVDLKGKHRTSLGRHEKIETKVQNFNTVLQANGKQLNSLASDFKSLSDRNEQIEGTLARGQIEQKEQLNSLEHRQSLIQERCDVLEHGMRGQRQQNYKDYNEFMSRLQSLEEIEVEKHKNVESVIEGGKIAAVGSDIASMRYVSLRSRIEDSYGDPSMPQATQCSCENSEQWPLPHLDKIQPLLLLGDESEEGLGRKEKANDSVADDTSTLPDDIDLDEGSSDPKDTVHCSQPASSCDLSILPANMANSGSDTNSTPGLMQAKDEDTASYLRNSRSVLLSLTSDIQNMALHRVIKGLYDVDQRAFCEKSLNLLTWSLETFDMVSELICSSQSKQATTANNDPESSLSSFRVTEEPQMVMDGENTNQIDTTIPIVEQKTVPTGLRRSSRVAKLAQQKRESAQTQQTSIRTHNKCQIALSTDREAVFDIGNAPESGNPCQKRVARNNVTTKASKPNKVQKSQNNRSRRSASQQEGALKSSQGRAKKVQSRSKVSRATRARGSRLQTAGRGIARKSDSNPTELGEPAHEVGQHQQEQEEEQHPQTEPHDQPSTSHTNSISPNNAQSQRVLRSPLSPNKAQQPQSIEENVNSPFQSNKISKKQQSILPDSQSPQKQPTNSTKAAQEKQRKRSRPTKPKAKQTYGRKRRKCGNEDNDDDTV